jgi:hypothetical protein
VKIVEPLLRRLRYDTGAMVALSRLYGERYLALIDDIMENPPEETPAGTRRSSRPRRSSPTTNGSCGWTARSTRSPSARLDPRLLRQDRRRAGRQFQGHQFFMFAHRPPEFTPSGVIGNPSAVTARRASRTTTVRRTPRRRAEGVREARGRRATRAWRAIVYARCARPAHRAAGRSTPRGRDRLRRRPVARSRRADGDRRRILGEPTGRARRDTPRTRGPAGGTTSTTGAIGRAGPPSRHVRGRARGRARAVA